jgi:CNT family concentrative nucleoside transporter
MDYLRGLLGIGTMIVIAFLFSHDRKKIDWRLVGIGVLLQLTFGFLVLHIPQVRHVFDFLSSVFVKVIDFSNKGASFIFGNLSSDQFGFIFAVRILPTIIFFSALTSGLYYLGVLQKVVFGIAWVMKRTLRISGAESLSSAGNIFLGQTEAPLLIKHFIKDMNRSQILCVMVGGMATLAGGVLASYIEFLGGADEARKQMFATHLLAASMMNAPGAIVMAKILYPQTEKSEIEERLVLSKEKLGVNLIDALAIGASEGIKLAAIIGGMLMAFISIIYLVNYILGDQLGALLGLNEWVKATTDGTFDQFSLQYILGQIFRPIVFMMGVDWNETLIVGSLLGEKTVINEFLAYKSLSGYREMLSEKSIIIATYALCGFSNFSSIAIQVGGLGSLAPEKRSIISQLGLKAVLGGTLACCMSASIAGMMS